MACEAMFATKTKVNLIGQTKHTLQLMHNLFSSIRNYFSHLLLVIQNWHRNIEIESAYFFPCSQYKIVDFLHSCSSIEHSIIQWSHCTARRPGRRSLPLVLALFRLKPQPPPKQGSDRPTRFSCVASLLTGGGWWSAWRTTDWWQAGRRLHPLKLPFEDDDWGGGVDPCDFGSSWWICCKSGSQSWNGGRTECRWGRRRTRARG
jgi:hypothetical protein